MNIHEHTKNVPTIRFCSPTHESIQYTIDIATGNGKNEQYLD